MDLCLTSDLRSPPFMYPSAASTVISLPVGAMSGSRVDQSAMADAINDMLTVSTRSQPASEPGAQSISPIIQSHTPLVSQVSRPFEFRGESFHSGQEVIDFIQMQPPEEEFELFERIRDSLDAEIANNAEISLHLWEYMVGMKRYEKFNIDKLVAEEMYAGLKQAGDIAKKNRDKTAEAKRAVNELLGELTVGQERMKRVIQWLDQPGKKERWYRAILHLVKESGSTRRAVILANQEVVVRKRNPSKWQHDTGGENGVIQMDLTAALIRPRNEKKERGNSSNQLVAPPELFSQQQLQIYGVGYHPCGLLDHSYPLAHTFPDDFNDERPEEVPVRRIEELKTPNQTPKKRAVIDRTYHTRTPASTAPDVVGVRVTRASSRVNANGVVDPAMALDQIGEAGHPSVGTQPQPSTPTSIASAHSPLASKGIELDFGGGDDGVVNSATTLDHPAEATPQAIDAHPQLPPQTSNLPMELPQVYDDLGFGFGGFWDGGDDKTPSVATGSLSSDRRREEEHLAKRVTTGNEEENVDQADAEAEHKRVAEDKRIRDAQVARQRAEKKAAQWARAMATLEKGCLCMAPTGVDTTLLDAWKQLFRDDYTSHWTYSRIRSDILDFLNQNPWLSPCRGHCDEIFRSLGLKKVTDYSKAPSILRSIFSITAPQHGHEASINNAVKDMQLGELFKDANMVSLVQKATLGCRRYHIVKEEVDAPIIKAEWTEDDFYRGEAKHGKVSLHDFTDGSGIVTAKGLLHRVLGSKTNSNPNVRIIEEEQEMYDYHLHMNQSATTPQERRGQTAAGVMPNMVHSLGQQYLCQHPQMYLMHVTLRKDHATELFSCPTPARYFKDGDDPSGIWYEGLSGRPNEEIATPPSDVVPVFFTRAASSNGPAILSFSRSVIREWLESCPGPQVYEKLEVAVFDKPAANMALTEVQSNTLARILQRHLSAQQQVSWKPFNLENGDVLFSQMGALINYNFVPRGAHVLFSTGLVAANPNKPGYLENGLSIESVRIANQELSMPTLPLFSDTSSVQQEQPFPCAVPLFGISPLSDAIMHRGGGRKFSHNEVRIDLAQWLPNKSNASNIGKQASNWEKSATQKLAAAWKRVQEIERQMFGKKSFYEYKRRSSNRTVIDLTQDNDVDLVELIEGSIVIKNELDPFGNLVQTTESEPMGEPHLGNYLLQPQSQPGIVEPGSLEQDEINTNEGDHNELVIETLRHQSQLNPERGGDNPDRGEPALDIILPQLQPQPQPTEEMSDTTMPDIHTVISHNRSIPANKSSLMAHSPPVRDIYDIPPDEPIRQTRARPAPLRRSQPFLGKTHHLEQDEMQINKGNHNEPASHTETILRQPPSTREEQGNYQINDTTEHTNMGRHHG